MTRSHQSRSLDSITVVSLEHATAAPFCIRQLADFGARVTRIERPGVGDFARGYDERVSGLSSHFVWTNRSKQSLSPDLKQAEALPLLEKLLADADMLMQNLAPGAAARLGLPYEVLCERPPRLIVCDISGYGEGGPYGKEKAYNLLVQSEGGFLSVTGGAGPNETAKAGCLIADIAAGVYAYSSTLSALLLRERTGEGGRIDVSMLENPVEWMGYPMYYIYQDASPPSCAGASYSTIYPYGSFSTGDDGTAMLGLQNEREWRAFCDKVLRCPELADDERFLADLKRLANHEELRVLVVEVFAALPAVEVVARLEQAQIANAHVNDMAGVWAHPQLQARQRWISIGSPAGCLPALSPPASSSAFVPRTDAVPALGGDSDALPAKLGCTAADIQRLRATGTVRGGGHEPTDRMQYAVRPDDPLGADSQGPCQRR